MRNLLALVALILTIGSASAQSRAQWELQAHDGFCAVYTEVNGTYVALNLSIQHGLAFDVFKPGAGLPDGAELPIEIVFQQVHAFTSTAYFYDEMAQAEFGMGDAQVKFLELFSESPHMTVRLGSRAPLRVPLNGTMALMPDLVDCAFQNQQAAEPQGSIIEEREAGVWTMTAYRNNDGTGHCSLTTAFPDGTLIFVRARTAEGLMLGVVYDGAPNGGRTVTVALPGGPTLNFDGDGDGRGVWSLVGFDHDFAHGLRHKPNFLLDIGDRSWIVSLDGAGTLSQQFLDCPERYGF